MWLGAQYDAFITLRGDAAESVERSPPARRFVKSGLPVPPPEPAKSSKHGVPSRRAT